MGTLSGRDRLGQGGFERDLSPSACSFAQYGELLGAAAWLRQPGWEIRDLHQQYGLSERLPGQYARLWRLLGRLSDPDSIEDVTVRSDRFSHSRDVAEVGCRNRVTEVATQTMTAPEMSCRSCVTG